MNGMYAQQIKAETVGATYEWIYIAKGIGIILVIIGHFDPEPFPIYWFELRKIIYSFHVPLFFILSGYLYNHGKFSYFDLIKSKTKRLLYPFASTATVFFLIKYAADSFFNIEYPVNISSIYLLLTDPVKSYMPLLWFVHALFLIFAIYPLVRLFMNNLTMLLLLIVINSFIGNNFFIFDKTIAHMPFFVIGIILRHNEKFSRIAIGTNWCYVVTPLTIYVILAYMIQPLTHYINGYYYSFLISIFGSLFVLNMSYAVSSLSCKSIKGSLLQIGYCSFTIYLYHTLFTSTVSIVFLQLFKHKQTPFELIAFVAIATGVVFPLILDKLLRKHEFSKNFILGLR